MPVETKPSANPFEIVRCQKIIAYTSTFPSRRYWYRHDTVKYNGQQLNGFIQVRCRSGRVEVTTSTGNACIMGASLEWLARQNGIAI